MNESVISKYVCVVYNIYFENVIDWKQIERIHANFCSWKMFSMSEKYNK